MKSKIQDIADIFIGHTFRGSIQDERNGDFFVLQAKNISDGAIVEDFPRACLGKARSKGIVQHGDVILSNRGSFKSATYTGHQKKLIAAASVYILRTKTPKMLPEYLTIFLNSSYGQKLLQEIQSGTIIASLPKSQLLSLKIPIPSIKKQEIIIAIHENHEKRSQLYHRRNELHKQITQASLTYLINS